MKYEGPEAPDEMFGWIEDMYALGPRRPGTEPAHRCEDYLADTLKKIGFKNVRKDPISIRVWQADRYKLTAGASDSDVPAHYIPYTAFTPPEGVEGKLLYVKPRDAASRLLGSWKDRIVVADIRFPKLDASALKKFALAAHDPEKTLNVSHCATWVRLRWTLYREASKRGAAGFIGILTDHYAGGHNYYAPYGFKEKDIHDKPIPGFWVDRVHGAEIRRLAKKGNARAKLLLTGEMNGGVTHNVIGELEGETDETFIIGCHHDSPFGSAVEDASGCAVGLAAAKHFARTRELKRTLIAAFTAGHFYGSIGTRTFIDRNLNGMLKKTALEFHVEHIAREAVERPGGKLEVLDRPEFSGAFVSFNRRIKRAVWKAFVEENLTRTLLLPVEGPFGNYPPTDGGDFHLAGVPIVNVISPPIYLLNAEDTPDKVAKDRLVPTARAVVRVLRELDGVPLSRLKRNDYPVRTALMKLLSRFVHLKAIAKGIY